MASVRSPHAFKQDEQSLRVRTRRERRLPRVEDFAIVQVGQEDIGVLNQRGAQRFGYSSSLLRTCTVRQLRQHEQKHVSEVRIGELAGQRNENSHKIVCFDHRTQQIPYDSPPFHTIPTVLRAENRENGGEIGSDLFVLIEHVQTAHRRHD